jgi:hypothetical protein
MKIILARSTKAFFFRISHWETWHWLIKYIPMIPFWVLYCIRARSLWFFTASNPTLTFGGYEGETKMEMYNLLPKQVIPKTILIKTSYLKRKLAGIVISSGISFPVAVKPDIGRMGLMFRKINSMDELLSYHEHMEVDYILQEFIEYPLEVSVFYYRFPNESKGNVTGFVKKESLFVTGDGTSTLLQLLLNHKRVQFRLEEMKIKHASNLQVIIPYKENYTLSEALNLSRGGKLVSLEHEKDNQLVEVFDELSHAGNFYFGRYDVKCKSIEDLKHGRHFSILEFNGSGAEPHHVYGNGNSLFQAIKILLYHWNVLYKISIENNRKGIPYWNFKQGYQHLLKAREHFKLLRQLEVTSQKLSHSIDWNTKLANENIIPAYQPGIRKSA